MLSVAATAILVPSDDGSQTMQGRPSNAMGRGGSDVRAVAVFASIWHRLRSLMKAADLVTFTSMTSPRIHATMYLTMKSTGREFLIVSCWTKGTTVHTRLPDCPVVSTVSTTRCALTTFFPRICVLRTISHFSVGHTASGKPPDGQLDIPCDI